MVQVSLHEAKTDFANLIDNALKGTPFVIAMDGKPVLVVRPYTETEDVSRRVGFLKGQIEVPEDFDSFGKDAIAAMFGVK